MKKIATFLMPFLLLALNLFAQEEHYFKFQIDKRSEIEHITRMISIDNVEDKTVYAYANEEQLERFKQKTDYVLELLDHPRTKAKVVEMATTVGEMSNWDKYPTYEVYVQMMNDFASDYPDICSLENIGTSGEGRDLLVLRISDNVEQEEDEPEFFYTSTMHGDETTGFVFMLRMIDSLLTQYGADPEITDYVNNMEIYINPNANPDGTYNGGNSDVSSATRSNSNGVDLNRNFPDPEDGQHPDGYSWQNETVAMMEFAEQNTLTLAGNFHGGAEVVNYPWDTWDREHVDDAWLQELSYAYANPALDNSPSGYFTGISSDGITNGYDWYTTSGSRQDYMNYYQQCREVTIEVSNQKLLSTDELRDYWNYNSEALFAYMEKALYGIKGIVTDESGNPIEAMVFVENHDYEPDSSMVFTDPDVGDYHRMIEDGTYDITFSAYGYYSETVNNVTVNTDDSVRVNVTLAEKPTYSINGTIVNGETGDPIENAEVTVLNSDLSPVYTNSSGAYTINNVMEGTNTLQIRKSGYATIRVDTLVDDSNQTFDLELYEAEIEDFESGDFASFGWNFTGDANWTITSGEFQEGAFAAQSGDIADNQESAMSIEIMVEESGNLSFYRKVSSEANYDFLEFYIDGSKLDSWSGSLGWAEQTYAMDAGVHSLTWKYVKDGAVSSGSDCAWIDYITFPKLVPPGLSFSPDSLEPFMDVDTTQTEILQLTNSGNGSIDYSLTVENAAANSWISIPANSGTVPSLQTENVSVEITTGSEDSVYTCDLLLTHNGAKKDTTIPVRVHADYYPELTIEPTEINQEILMDSIRSTYLKMTNTGSGVLTYDATIENPGDHPWLSIENTSGSIEEETDSIKVTFDASGMESGIYNATILINDNSKGQTQIPVTLIINEPESFTFNPQEISTSLPRYKKDTVRFWVKNIIPETLHLELYLQDSTYASLYQLETVQSTLDNGDSVLIECAINPQGLPAGEYTTNVVAESQMRYIKQLPVTVEVQEQDMLAISPDTVKVTMGEFEELTRELSIANLLDQPITLHYSIDGMTPDSPIQIDQTGDTLDPSSEVIRTLSFDPEGLATGEHQLNLAVTSDFRDEIDVPVLLTVQKQDVLILNPGNLDLSLPVNEKDTMELSIENSSGTEVTYSVKTTIDNYNWIDVAPMSAAIQGETSATLKVYFSAEDMETGNYSTELQIAQSYNDSLFTIPIAMEVERGSAIQTSSLNDQVQVICYPNPFYQNFNLELSLKSAQKRINVTLVNSSGQVLERKVYRNLQAGRYKELFNLSNTHIRETEYFYLKVSNETGSVVKKLLHLK